LANNNNLGSESSSFDAFLWDDFTIHIKIACITKQENQPIRVIVNSTISGISINLNLQNPKRPILGSENAKQIINERTNKIKGIKNRKKL
jgi:hypothetical protein